MKKNYLYGLFATSMLLMTSCQQDNLVGDWQDNGNLVSVKMSVSLPEMQNATRAAAFGDGTTAKKLHYGVFEVYDVNKDGKIDRETERVYLRQISGFATFNNKLEADIVLKLMPKSTYDIAFWAASDNAPYVCTFEGATASVDVNYQGVFSNNENNDAFFGTTTVTEVALDGGNTLVHNDGEPIKLYRPFAQLNIATSTEDYEAASKAGFKVTETEVVIGGIYEVLDLWTGNVSMKDNGETNPRVYQKAEIPGAEYTFPIVSGQKYLSMNYLLMPKDKETLSKVTFKHYTADGREKVREFGNIPAQRNWRTNIYGDLLTSDVQVKVAIAPLFADENGVDDDKDYNPDSNEWYDREQDKQ